MSTKVSDYDNRFALRWIDLAQARLGGEVLYATDDFFAEKENLIKPGRGVFIEDKYTENGKWMDGWESRRKRVEGHDYAVLKLGLSGIIKGFDIDTNHFLGNHPPHASVEACCLPEGQSPDFHDDSIWTEILSKSELAPGSQNFFEISSPQRWTHLRLHIYPDGGVARLKVHGIVQPDWENVPQEEILDFLAVQNGGMAVICNDMFFSSKENLIMPGRGVNMGDGWETRRRREPGNDWIILSLGHRCIGETVLIDTAHFKGNYPDRFDLWGADLSTEEEVNLESYPSWKPIISQTKLEADNILELSNLENNGPFTHLKMNIYPDGGVSRLRFFGRKSI